MREIEVLFGEICRFNHSIYVKFLTADVRDDDYTLVVIVLRNYNSSELLRRNSIFVIIYP